MNDKEFYQSLLFLNCAHNFKEEYRNIPECKNEQKCFSTTCMLNGDQEMSDDIQAHGCVIYRMKEVQDKIKQ